MQKFLLSLILALVPLVSTSAREPITLRAIGFDAITEPAETNFSASKTWSHTVTGSNPILFVNIYCLTTEIGALTGATYAGAAMTEVGRDTNTSNVSIVMYVKTAPATGANNVVITFSGSVTAIGGKSLSYTGADSSGQPVEFDTDSQVAQTSITGTLTTTVDQSWLHMGIILTLAGSTAGASTTQRDDGTTGLGMFDSNAGRSTGSNSLVANFSSANVGMVIASFKPSAGGAASFIPGIINTPVRGGGRVPVSH